MKAKYKAPDTILLLTCGGQKADAKDAPHKDGFTPDQLYTGAFFKSELRYAQSTQHRWAVIGLKYGVIPHDRRLMPYDLLPPRKIVDADWRVRVLAQLHSMKVKRVLFVTNFAYYEPFIGCPGTAWAFDSLTTKKGMGGIGKKNGWMFANRGKVPTIKGVLPRSITPGPGVVASTRPTMTKRKATARNTQGNVAVHNFVIDDD